MNLFDKIPSNLFSVLSSKNKEIYVTALFVLRRAYQENLVLRRDDLITQIIYNLEDGILGLEEEDLPEEKNLATMAYFFLRKLESTGWIERDYIPGTFDEQIILPNYALKIINTLYELATVSEKEYNGYVYNTYSALKTADTERNEYMYSALKNANDSTAKLIDELKNLSTEIRNYNRLLAERSKMREVLADHFDNFKQLVEDKIYYPLKTFDSVPRFKGPILTILRSWLYDSGAKQVLTDSALRMKAFANEEDAFHGITVMIGDIAPNVDRTLMVLRVKDKTAIRSFDYKRDAGMVSEESAVDEESANLNV